VSAAAGTADVLSRLPTARSAKPNGLPFQRGIRCLWPLHAEIAILSVWRFALEEADWGRRRSRRRPPRLWRRLWCVRFCRL